MVSTTVHPRGPERRQRTAHAVAALLVESDLEDRAIADQLGISVRTLTRIKSDAGFDVLLAQARQRAQTALLRYPIARKLVRMRSLNQQWERMNALFAARAEQDADVPGIETGLLWPDTKLSASGDTVNVWGVDPALMREYRETLKQAAIEMGEWAEGRNVKLDIGAFLEEARRLARELGVEESAAVAAAEAIVRGKA